MCNFNFFQTTFFKHCCLITRISKLQLPHSDRTSSHDPMKTPVILLLLTTAMFHSETIQISISNSVGRLTTFAGLFGRDIVCCWKVNRSVREEIYRGGAC